VTACSRRRCCPNRPVVMNILSHWWEGYFCCNHSTRCILFLTNRFGKPSSCASANVTVSQSSGWMNNIKNHQKKIWAIILRRKFKSSFVSTCWMPRARSRRSNSSNIIFFTSSCSRRSNLSAICFNGSGPRSRSFLLPPTRSNTAYLRCNSVNQRKSLSNFTTEGLYGWRCAKEGAPITIWQRSEVPRLGNQGDKPLAFILPCSAVVNSRKGFIAAREQRRTRCQTGIQQEMEEAGCYEWAGTVHLCLPLSLNRKGINQHLMHIRIFIQQPCTLNMNVNIKARQQQELPHKL